MENSQQAELLIRMTRTAWDAQNSYLHKLINELSDDKIAAAIAPGKNTGTYLLGHLVAVSDAMLPLLAIGEKLFPEMEAVYITSPDNAGNVFHPVAVLKQRLDAVNTALNNGFNGFSTADWLDRHMSVSPEDFLKEPHRNKLNVLISRTNHMANHIGQMLLLK